MFKKIKIVCLLFASLLVLYTLLRIGFYLMYYRAQSPDGNWWSVFYWGMRLDFTALFYINLPFCCYYFFLYPWLPQPLSTKIAAIAFLVFNIPFLAINFIDLGYFSFNNRRSTTDILFVIADSMPAIGAFVKDYWYLFLLFALAVWLLIVVTNIILKRAAGTTNTPWYKQYIIGVISLLLSAFIARGNSTRPIMPTTPLLYFDAEWQPLVSNSTITFLYSAFKRQTQLEVKKYFSPKTLDSLFSIKRQYTHDKAFQRKNVVIIMLESFCREYLEPGNDLRAQTPFLDSIISKSTWYSNAYANGFSSNRGVVSILGSMPTFLDEPYFKSNYSNNRIRGIGTILKEQGYSTHFFYGANLDHFGFGKFCKMLGIDRQHTREDFNDERFFDGNWGIYDDKFLPFAGSILQKEDTPFLAVLFNISSHPPFALPPGIKERFDFKGQQPGQRSAAYVDYSVRLFFDQIKNANWFKNTLFVFTADHSLIHVFKRSSVITSLRIPVFLYDPADTVHRVVSKTVQQLDIVPTILDRIAYSGAFMAFGHSMDDTTSSYPATKHFGIQLIDTSFLFRFNMETDEAICLYKIDTDSAMKYNLLNQAQFSSVRDRMLKYSKAYVQRYNNALIQNQLYIK